MMITRVLVIEKRPPVRRFFNHARTLSTRCFFPPHRKVGFIASFMIAKLLAAVHVGTVSVFLSMFVRLHTSVAALEIAPD